MEPQRVYPKVSFPTLCDWIFVQPDVNEDSWTCTLCNTESIKKSNAPGNLIKHCASNKCIGFTMPLIRASIKTCSHCTSVTQNGKQHEHSPTLLVFALKYLLLPNDYVPGSI